MEATNPKSKRKRSQGPRRNTAKSNSPTADIEDFSSCAAAQIRASLLRWYDSNRRALPWRSSVSAGAGEDDRAYSVWVSEVMLQQTRVQAVVEYYNRWMARWPTLRHLAAATQEEVNEMWAGLGYYRRARFLLEGAKLIVEEGEFPRTAATLHEVRGIGKYTAGAIASIAFGEVVPVVDGNVVRVISRLKSISSNPKETAIVKSFWRLAGQLVDPQRPGDFNQAIMELGATLCSKTSPGCLMCPVSDECCAFQLSRNNKSVNVTDYPSKVAKAKPRHDFAAVCVIELAEDLGGEFLQEGDKRHVYILIKRPEEGLLAGLWEFPSVLIDEKKTDQSTRRKAMDKYLKKSFGFNVGRGCNVVLREDVGEYVHVFSHIRLRMFVEFMILTLKGFPEGGTYLLLNGQDSSTVTWKSVDGDSIKCIGLTSGVRKVYNMIREFKKKQIPQHSKRASGQD